MLIAFRYYKIIHNTYPILSTTKSAMLQRLISCPPHLREAFYEALHVAVCSYPSSSPRQHDHQASRRVTQLITLSQSNDGSVRSFSHNLIYLQTMLLMAIEVESQPPLNSNTGGLSWSVLLGSAVGLAYSMKLYLHKHSDAPSENDPNTDDKISRRLWWCLVIMDRWHASSTGSPSLIPDSSVVVYPEDQALLGENLYQLARK